MRNFLESTAVKVCSVIGSIVIVLVIIIFFADPFFFSNTNIDEGNLNLCLGQNYKMNLNFNAENYIIIDNTIIDKSINSSYDEEIMLGDKSSITFTTLKEGQTIIRVFEKNRFNSNYKIHNYNIQILKNPYNIDKLILKSSSTNEKIEINTNKVDSNGNVMLKQAKPVDLMFGETYKMVGVNHIYKDSILKNNKLNLCNYCDGEECEFGIKLTDDGLIKIDTLTDGSFSYYSSIYGGINFDFNVKFDDSRFYNDLVNTYNVLNKTKLSDFEINDLLNAAKDFVTLKCESVPNYLNENIIENIIPNVSKIEVNYNDENTNGECYLPANIKELSLKSKNIKNDYLSIKGAEKSNLKVMIDGPISLTSYNKSLFYNFEKLSINIKETKLLINDVNDKYFGNTNQNIVYLKGEAGDDVFTGIKFFQLENNAPLVIEGGDGLDSCINGCGQKGGDGINAYNVEITTTKKMFVKSGNGGDGENASRNYTKMVPGSEGMDGLSGGHGADSGIPIKANKLILYGSKDHSEDYGLNIISGNGGKGGNGTDGQDGSYANFEHTEGARDGFDGGDGGNGGNGGTSLPGLQLTFSLENYISPINITNGQAGKGGSFGKAGKGGQGKDEKFIFITKNKGHNGINGQNGIAGADGISLKVSESSFYIVAGKINICE